jgi:hypothetical protein
MPQPHVVQRVAKTADTSPVTRWPSPDEPAEGLGRCSSLTMRIGGP